MPSQNNEFKRLNIERTKNEFAELHELSKRLHGIAVRVPSVTTTSTLPPQPQEPVESQGSPDLLPFFAFLKDVKEGKAKVGNIWTREGKINANTKGGSRRRSRKRRNT